MIVIDLIVIIPLVLATASFAAGSRWHLVPRLLGSAASVAQLVLLAMLVPSGLLKGVHLAGVGGAGYWQLGTDGLSTPLLALTALTGLLAVSASWKVTHRAGAHFGLLALLQAAVALVFLAEDLFLFYVAWESVLIPMFLLIGGWGSAGSRRAATKFLVYTFAGGAVLLVGVLFTLVVAGTSSIPTLAASGVENPWQPVLFWLLAVGFLVKVPAVPLHTWLPDAHTEAPTAGSIVLAGVLLKMGGYGLIRIAGPFAPDGFGAGAGILAGLGIIGIIWGAATALVQSDLKRLIAYSSVAHMGFVLLAISIGTPAALSAALVTMVSHGFVAGLLFYLVGALYERSHTRMLDDLGGLGDTAPRWSVAFVFAVLASAGLPGLSGFPGEFVTLLESYSAYGWWMAVAGVGVVLAAAYNLRAVRASVQGEHGKAQVTDLGVRESLTALIGMALILVLGVAPWLITSMAAEPLTRIARLMAGAGS